MFFWVNRKLSIQSIPVLIGRFLKRYHNVFRLISLLIGCFFPRVLCTKCYKASDLDGNNSMAKCGSDSPCASSTKKKIYTAKYKPEWATDLQFICHSDKGPTFGYCRVCNTHLNVVYGGKSDIVRHASSASYSTLQKATSSPTATQRRRVLDVSKDRH